MGAVEPDDRQDRPELYHHGEGLGGIAIVDQSLGHDQVAGRGDRQKLGQTLDHAQDHGAQDGVHGETRLNRSRRKDTVVAATQASAAPHSASTSEGKCTPR